MSRRRRELGEDERALWRRVTETVIPLRPRLTPVPETAASAPEPPPSEPPAERRPAPAPTATVHAGRPPPPAPRPRPERLDHGIAPGLDRRSLDRLRRGRIPVESVLDLHGHSQEEAREFLRRFLASSQSAGRRCVLVVTGKGLRRNLSGEGEAGVLRRMVPLWLNDDDNRGRVLAFCHATPPHGGAGALYVLLRRVRSG